jgi:hypothetical protein
LGLLDDLERHVRNGHERIAQQKMLIATMERDGYEGIGQARSLLANLKEGQELHERRPGAT